MQGLRELESKWRARIERSGRKMRFIGDLREGDMVSETYLCKVKQTLKTKAGKSYYSLILQDKTGTVDAKVWDLGNGIDHFESMDYIHIDAQVTCFQNSLQLNVKRIRKSQEGEYNPTDYMPVTSKDINEMYQQLLDYIERMEQPYIKKLAQSFFVEDKEFQKKFKSHSAAKSVHHGYIGGLLEHTLGVVNLCSYLAENYPMLQRDILLMGAMFHDIGKLEELSEFPENDYTDEGQLFGHIMIGSQMISQRIAQIEGFPKKIRNELIHCILSHHGELEYGSPKKPATMEALALSFADNADAKLQTMKEALLAGDEKSEWVGYNRFFESNIRRTNC